MSTISKTTFTFTVLHRTDQPLQSIEQALEEADTGHAVGNITAETTSEMPDEQVTYELRTLGNDGEFFDDDLTDEGTD